MTGLAALPETDGVITVLTRFDVVGVLLLGERTDRRVTTEVFLLLAVGLFPDLRSATWTVRLTRVYDRRVVVRGAERCRRVALERVDGAWRVDGAERVEGA